MFIFTTVERPTLERTLDSMGERQADQWVVADVLYVRIEEPPNWSDGWQAQQVDALVDALGLIPPRLVAVDVSGRVAGRSEVLTLVRALLSLGSGVCSDDYSSHAWSLTEIDLEQTVDGHRFFVRA